MRPPLAISTGSSNTQRSAMPAPLSLNDGNIPSGIGAGNASKRDEQDTKFLGVIDEDRREGVSAANSGGIGVYPDNNITVKRIHDAVVRRLSLLKYLRIIYATDTHWFNTIRFAPAQIRSFPSMYPSRLSKRTQSMLLLGVSIPFVLDPNHDSVTDYLRTFSALLSEYDTYVAMHAPENSTSSTLSRARIPQLFKRNPGRSRRGSSGEALLSTLQSASDEYRATGSSSATFNLAPGNVFWSSYSASTQENDVSPGEDYQLLLTPNLPFDADYFETFETLCEVLSDSYEHILRLLEKDGRSGGDSGSSGPPGTLDLFTKVDAKVKKILLAGLVKEFEDASKQGIRRELGGVGKLVLGNLI